MDLKTLLTQVHLILRCSKWILSCIKTWRVVTGKWAAVKTHSLLQLLSIKAERLDYEGAAVADKTARS